MRSVLTARRAPFATMDRGARTGTDLKRQFWTHMTSTVGMEPCRMDVVSMLAPSLSLRDVIGGECVAASGEPFCAQCLPKVVISVLSIIPEPVTSTSSVAGGALDSRDPLRLPASARLRPDPRV